MYHANRHKKNALQQLRKDHDIAMRLLKDHHDIDDLVQIKDMESRVRVHSDEISALNSGTSARDTLPHLQQKQSANATQLTLP